MKKKIKTIGLWVLILGVFAVLLGFNNHQLESTALRQTEIEIVQPPDQPLVVESDFTELLNAQKFLTDSSSVTEINIQMLEETLEAHQQVEKVEVYSTLTGSVFIEIYQKTAFARVLTDTERFYLDAKGNPFPLSKHFSASVPLISGKTDSISLYGSFQLLKAFIQNPTWEGKLEGIHVNQDQSLTAYTSVGSHKVNFGQPIDLASKLKKLQLFYEQGTNPEKLAKIKSIDLRFNQQVVVQN